MSNRSPLAIIGGTGLCQMPQVVLEREQAIDTPYGQPSSVLRWGTLAGQPVVFLPRHGNPHAIPPHKINYRANLWALKEAGVAGVLAVNAVGGIHPSLPAGAIQVPDQVIDYTWGREHTYYDGSDGRLEHVDFTEPYDARLRDCLLQGAARLSLSVAPAGTYAATQGPRLESAGEIRRLQRDGCDVVGMTGMPEAALARELGLPYAAVCLVVNPAAGLAQGEITMAQIEAVLATGMGRVVDLLAEALTIHSQ